MQGIPTQKPHKAGFVSIVGKPNVGKSTLMNALVGERLSIITSKAQTTRHRILGIVNGTFEGTDFQLVYSDTPGIICPQYQLQETMMAAVSGSLEDADVILFVTDLFEQYEAEQIVERLESTATPVLLLLNKTDLATPLQLAEKQAYWQERFPAWKQLPVSALHRLGLEAVFAAILDAIPVHPPYYDKDQLTDRPERFFAAEIIREKIFLNYKKEVPYSCEVVVMEFRETEELIRIQTEIFVERTTQRIILLGRGGEAIKQVGMQARQEMEAFFQKQVHLETYVRVEPDWRKKALKLREFGYLND